jgi:hypothetical protein
VLVCEACFCRANIRLPLAEENQPVGGEYTRRDLHRHPCVGVEHTATNGDRHGAVVVYLAFAPTLCFPYRAIWYEVGLFLRGGLNTQINFHHNQSIGLILSLPNQPTIS